jgi:hypothetical protein
VLLFFLMCERLTCYFEPFEAPAGDPEQAYSGTVSVICNVM